MMNEMNYFAVLLAGIVAMALGFVWYSPLVLGTQWMREKKFTKESLKNAQKEMGKWYAVSLVGSIIMAYALSYVMILSQNYFQYVPLSTGVISGFWMWFGFVMPVQLTATIFGDKNFKLMAIDTGYQLVSLLGMGIVIALM